MPKQNKDSGKDSGKNNWREAREAGAAQGLFQRGVVLQDFKRFAADDSERAQQNALTTVDLVFTTGAPVKRFDWLRERYYLEELVVSPDAMRLGRLESGAPALDSHSSWSMRDVVGVTSAPKVADGKGRCTVTFSRRDAVRGLVQDVEDGIVRNISVGYRTHKMEMVPPEEDGGTWVYRAVDWEPVEVSFVPVPADAGCQTERGEREAKQEADALMQRGAEWFDQCAFVEVARSQPDAQQEAAPIEQPTGQSKQVQKPTAGGEAEGKQPKERVMPKENEVSQGGSNPAADEATATATATATAPVAGAARADDAVAAERKRSADVMAICQKHGYAERAADWVADGLSVDQVRARILDAEHERSGGDRGRSNVRVETVQDAHEMRLRGLAGALMHRVDPSHALDENSQQYAYRTLVDVARICLEARGVKTAGMPAMKIAEQAVMMRSAGMQGTSDFAYLMSGVVDKRLASAYEMAPATYNAWARRAANHKDFKGRNVVQLSDVPELKKLNEHGEITYASFGDSAEQYRLYSYGRAYALTFEAIVNDDFGILDRPVARFAAASRDLENTLVYGELLNGKMSDGKHIFHADHNNLLTGAGSALSFDGLSAARKALRTQKNAEGKAINIKPVVLLVPAALETKADQLMSTVMTAAKSDDINVFAGRMQVVVAPELDAVSETAWYLLPATNGLVETIEYAHLEGYEQPSITTQAGFEVNGIKTRCIHYFGTKAIDYRGMVKSEGV